MGSTDILYGDTREDGNCTSDGAGDLVILPVKFVSIVSIVSVVSRPRWLNNLKYCWLNINLPYERIGARRKNKHKTKIRGGSIQSEYTGNQIQRFA